MKSKWDGSVVRSPGPSWAVVGGRFKFLGKNPAKASDLRRSSVICAAAAPVKAGPGLALRAIDDKAPDLRKERGILMLQAFPHRVAALRAQGRQQHK